VQPYPLIKAANKESVTVRAAFYSKGPVLTYRLWAGQAKAWSTFPCWVQPEDQAHLLPAELAFHLALLCPNGTTPESGQAAGGQQTAGLSPKLA